MLLRYRIRHALLKSFTLIELITVIAIIAVLMGLLLPAVQQVRNQANKARAKSDVLNIVSAVKSFYTDYGQYPNVAAPAAAPTADAVIGPGTVGVTYANSNYMLMDILRATTSGSSSPNASNAVNTRQVVYLDVPTAKSASAPKGGITTSAIGSYVNGYAVNVGDLMDPWGVAYFVAIDYNYDNAIEYTTKPWVDQATGTIRAGVIAWSLGVGGTNGLVTSGSLGSLGNIVSFQ